MDKAALAKRGGFDEVISRGQHGAPWKVSELRKLIEDWYVSDFHVEDARAVQDAGYDERLSSSGDNLALVVKYLYDNHHEVFQEILSIMESRASGACKVDAQETADGRIVLRFQDGAFKDPFASRFVSDGTIKMFIYLLLLKDPEKLQEICWVNFGGRTYCSKRWHLHKRCENLCG